MRRIILLVGVVALVSTGLGGSAGALPGSSYSYTGIDFPGAGVTQVDAISNSGAIAGRYGDSQDAIEADPGHRLHGFVLAHGTYTTVDVPGTEWTFPEDINEDGSVVGFSGRYNQTCCVLEGATRGFRYDRGTLTTYGAPFGYPHAFVGGGNSRGQTVGWTAQGDGRGVGFVEYRGTFTKIVGPGAETCSTYLIDINDVGHILGSSSSAPAGSDECGNGFLWIYRRGTFEPIVFPPGAAILSAQAINNPGSIGGAVFHDGRIKGYVLSRGVMTLLEYPGADATEVQAINDHGQAAGYYYINGIVHGYVAKPH